MTSQRQIGDSGAKLIIMEKSNISVIRLDVRTEWVVGRSVNPADADRVVALHTPIVSRFHGQLQKKAGSWYYIDNPANTNGTMYNGVVIKSANGHPGYVRLYEGDVLRIDKQSSTEADSNAVVMLFTVTPMEAGWMQYPIKGKQTVVIGRSPKCDIVQSLPYLSAKHAQITMRDGGYYLNDCGSKAGTYLNRKRVSGTVRLRDKDCFYLADRLFFLIGDTIFCMGQKFATVLHTDERPVILRANIRTKRVKSQSGSGTLELIRGIQLEIKQGTLVAMLGTAGAGKTTVMNCLNGMDLQGVEGSVVYRNVELLQNYDQMKSLIGSVPQKKIFHKTFSPEQEFWFAARKRLPGDTTREEIQSRVDKTLEMLSIEGVRKSPNGKLSGGEQTRVNVGIELVADRDLLCLDEPDQGLSPNYKRELFEILRKLAHENGKTMLTIIHDVSEIDMFDQVIMLAKKDGVGRLAFSGTPQEARNFFGVDIRDAYTLLDKHPERYIR